MDRFWLWSGWKQLTNSGKCGKDYFGTEENYRNRSFCLAIWFSHTLAKGGMVSENKIWKSRFRRRGREGGEEGQPELFRRQEGVSCSQIPQPPSQVSCCCADDISCCGLMFAGGTLFSESTGKLGKILLFSQNSKAQCLQVKHLSVIWVWNISV